MKVFIGIVSCERDRHCHQVVRDTWLKDCPVDYKFLMGCPTIAPDELELQCGDGYADLTEKALASFRWVLERDYDFMLHIGRDTYVNVPRLLAAELEAYDYAGHGGGQGDTACLCSLDPDPHGRYAYASGGAGSWLSRKAMQLILDSPIRHEADDLMFGWILGKAGIPLYHDPRFGHHGQRLYDPSQFTVHLSRGTGNYLPAWMQAAHRQSV